MTIEYGKGLYSSIIVHVRSYPAKIAVVGSYGVGMTMRVPRLPAAGETLSGGEFAVGPGGKGSNQAVAASRLGAEVELLTCVGPDHFGQEARALWRQEGVGVEQVKTGEGPTMVGFILVEPSGENRIVIAPGALDELRPADVEAFAPSIEAADACLVSLEIPLSSAVEALAVARRVGTATILNCAPACPLPTEAWGLIDVLICNLSEAQCLCECVDSSADLLLQRLRERHDGTTVLTLGADGAVLGDLASQVYLAAPEVERVIDTTGAGDAFTAAFAVALAEGQPADDAVRFANQAGAHCVSSAEVIPSLPHRRELKPTPV